MKINKLFPIEYTEDETKEYIINALDELNNGLQTDGEKHSLERNIRLAQSHLVNLAFIRSNEQLNSQQSILSQVLTDFRKAVNDTKKETKIIIWTGFITLILTSLLDIYHIFEQSHNQKTMIELQKENIEEIQKQSEDLLTKFKELHVLDSINFQRLDSLHTLKKISTK